MDRDFDKKSPNKSRLNCWEYMKCGKQPGGGKVDNSASALRQPIPPMMESTREIALEEPAGLLPALLAMEQSQGSFAEKQDFDDEIKPWQNQM